jgi:CheY-like chemotaxis protein
MYSNARNLVLTDVNMSNMDCYEFIRWVRADGKYNGVPIISVSTESEAKDKTKEFEARRIST